MNIQDKMQEIHHKYGVTEKANYEIQLFVEALLKEQKEQLILYGVSQQRELLEAYQHFIDWNEEHDRKASTSERIESFIASNCG